MIQLPSLNWSRFEEMLLLNPRLPAADRDRMEGLWQSRPPLADHLWLGSSGTSADLKIIALSRGALMASARAVNDRIQASARDRWLLTLPTFHVGGLGILVRAHLSGTPVETLERWNAEDFYRLCSEARVTLSSLVPLQLQEVCALGHRAPRQLRALIIGGGALSGPLKARALSLGYPVLESFGMTECASQIATETFEREGLEALSLWTLSCDVDQRLKVSGEALCTAILSDKIQIFPKKDGYFLSQDRVDLKQAAGKLIVCPLGRGSDFAKIRGENVNLFRLQEIAEELLPRFPMIREAALYFVDDPVRGEKEIQMALVAPGAADIAGENFLSAFRIRVLPFERPRSFHFVKSLPRNPLGKLLLHQIDGPKKA